MQVKPRSSAVKKKPVEIRDRKSKFVKLFTKTPEGVFCPHFYELILSNGCPFQCAYCYLKLTFRGKNNPVLFSNSWEGVQKELDAIDSGVFSTGELADSLAIAPPLLEDAMEYFANSKNRYLLLVTKSTNIKPLLNRKPSRQIIISFSINSESSHRLWEASTPSPQARLNAAKELISRGWRVRVRLDPIIWDGGGINDYQKICTEIVKLKPERITVGTLRQYPGLFNFSPQAPKTGLQRSDDGRMRYTIENRINIYKKIASWLDCQPALCKETDEVWRELGWSQKGCNCTE